MRYWLLFLISTTTLADDMKTHHQQGETFAQQIQQSASKFDTSVLPSSFTNNPTQANYSVQDLSNHQKIKNDEADFLKQNFTKRPQFVLGTTQNIQLDANNCVEVKDDCQTTYNNHTCEEAIHSKEFSCAKDLIVNVHQPQAVNEIISIRVDSYNYDDTSYHIDMQTGELLKITGEGASGVTANITLSNTIPEEACPSLNISQHRKQIITERGFRTKRTRAYFIQTPNCENDLTAVVFIHQKKGEKWARRGAVFEFKVSYQPPRAIQSETWQNNCLSFEEKASSGTCKLIKEECVDGPSTKNISGLDVTRSCWKKKVTYDCHYAKAKNNCGALRQKGCEQINSECIEKTASGLCAIHKQTYRCPTQDCSKTKTVCPDTGFCSDGKCDTKESEPNQDFQKAITALSAAKEAGANFDEKLNQVFKGTKQTCRTAFAGFRNCCKDKGWGIDLSLTECKAEEADLGLQKQEGQCHYVGKYCSKEEFGVCLEKKKAYCCFQSKLGRLVQEQGRLQLNQDWGSGKHPACSGLTPEQLQKIDFSKMDLGEFHQDVTNKTKLPDLKTTSTRVQQRIEQFFGGQK